MEHKKKYDLVFVTNLPSFYKLNLYNRLAKKKKIFVIFTGNDAEIRNKDFFDGDYYFDFFSLSSKTEIFKALQAVKLLYSLKYAEIVLGGWDSFTMWLLVYFSPKSKNSIVVESSYLESNLKSIRGFLKREYLKRITKAYVPGSSNRKLLLLLGFKHKIALTKGVGIFNIVPQPPYKPQNIVRKFLYVGRLSPEKNIQALINVFKELPHLTLDIVGFGPLENYVKNNLSDNIKFLGAINNRELSEIYQAHDVFILPSLKEPWGLVVEEALNNGLPVIVSNNVGCADEIVNDKNGIIFSLRINGDLKRSIIKMTDSKYYNKLKKHISTYDFYKISDLQINSYL